MTVGPVVRNDASAPFFDGTARGEFLLRRCTTAQLISVPRPVAMTGVSSTDPHDGQVRASGPSTWPPVAQRRTSTSPRAAASKNSALASSRSTAGNAAPPGRVPVIGRCPRGPGAG